MAFLTRLSVISRSSIHLSKRTMSSSFQDAVSRLRSPVKELISVVTENGQRYIGENENDQKDVVRWIKKSTEVVVEGRLNVSAL